MAMQSLWMLAATLSFAVMSVCIKLGAEHFTTAELVFYRSAFSGLFMYWVMRRRRIPLRTTRLGMHVRRAACSVLGLFMFFHAMAELPLATAVTLNYTSPLFVVVLALWLSKERPGRAVMTAVALGFAGVLLLLKPTIAADQWLAGVVGLLSGATSAVTYYNIRELVRAQEPESRIVFYYGILGSLGALLIVVPTGWHAPTGETIVPLLGVAFMGTLGQIFMTRAFGQGRTMVSATLSFSGIVFSSLFGMWIWGDVLTWSSWAGMLIIAAAGVIAVQWPPVERDATAVRSP
jgi:drug/metabolite transporter (DMT)-like permease